MKYNIAIVEDSKEYQSLIQSYLNKSKIESGWDFEVFYYDDGDEIVENYESKYHIIFLDIEMKRLDGMSTARLIRKYDQEVIIIFITNMAQYAIEGYSVNALGYLLKPLSYFAFKQELKKCIAKINSRKQAAILIPLEIGVLKLNVQNILFIESYRHSLMIVTKDQTYEMRGTIKEMENKLKEHNFFRANSCYLVNLYWVSGVEGDFCIIENHKLKISRPRKKGFMDALTNYIGELL